MPYMIGDKFKPLKLTEKRFFLSLSQAFQIDDLEFSFFSS